MLRLLWPHTQPQMYPTKLSPDLTQEVPAAIHKGDCPLGKEKCVVFPRVTAH